MQKKSKNQKIQKYLHDYRKYETLGRIYKEKLMDKTLSAEEYFCTALKYDLIHSYNALYTYKLVDDFLLPYEAFFLRRFMETYAIIFAYKQNLLNESNFKLFKIMSQNRPVGKKEGDKLKKEFGLSKIKKSFQELMEEDDFLYLRGLTPNYTNPLEIIHAYDFEDKSLTQEEIIDNYIRCSLMIHFGNTEALSDNEKFYKEPLLFADKVTKEILQPDLRKITKIDKLNDDIPQSRVDRIMNPFKNVDYLKSVLSKDNLKEIFFALAKYNLIIKRMLFIYVGEEYDRILAFPKLFFETLPIEQYLARLDSISDKDERYKAYIDVLFFKAQHPDYDFPDTEEANQLFRGIYNQYKKKGLTTKDFYNFRITAFNSPIYLIFLKAHSFTDLANKFLENGLFSHDYETLFRLYNESVYYSHGDGLNAFMKYDNIRSDAKIIIITILEAICNFIEEIKKDIRVVLSLNSKEIISALDTYKNNILMTLKLL